MPTDGAANLSLHGSTYRQRDFSGVGVRSLRTTDSVFEACVFRNFDVRQWTSVMPGARSIFRDCRFEDFAAAVTVIGDVRFEGVEFGPSTHLGEWFSNQAEYIGCQFQGRIQKGWVSAHDERLYAATGRHRNEVVWNDFSQCDLVDFGFRGGVVLDKQRLPSGPDYLTLSSPVAALSAAWGAISELPTELQPFARGVLRMLELRVEQGQSELFLSLRGLGLDSPPWEPLVTALSIGTSS